MKFHHVRLSAAAIGMLAACVAALPLTAQGSTQLNGGGAANADVSDPSSVPITSVSLFSSGVGYFERQGSVRGSGTLQFRVDTANMDDLLKSMILRDLDGGKILGMNYASQDPLTRALAAFAVNLSGDPSVADILNQLRGEEVEITASETLRGRILGVESRSVGGGVSTRPDGSTIAPVEKTFLNLYSDRGMQSVSLDEVRAIRFVRPELDREVQLALSLISQGRNKDKKQVLVQYSGQGRRRIQIGYLQEMPVWKTTYRLSSDPGGLFVQGWALVENTTDEDWNGVKLNLVAGRPISFKMDLYSPIYLPRPELSLGIAQAPVPPAYQQNLAAGAARGMAKSAPAPSALREAPQYGAAADEAAPSDFGLTQGVESSALAAQAGAFFQYTIGEPVSIRRRESAMVPIVNQKIDGERLSVYNQQVDAVHPLNGLKLKNSTGLYLNAGPITVFEDGQYAGDARIENLAPGAERLISFSVDLDTEVVPNSRSIPDLLVSAKIDRGTLIITRTLRRERDYTVKFDGTKARTLLLEYPLDSSWTLVEPASPAERTRDFYRFAVPLVPGKSSDLKVVEKRNLDQRVVLSSAGLDTIQIYQRANEVSASVRTALSKLSSLRTQLAAIKRDSEEVNRQLQQIYSDQSRIRSNMSSLDRTSALYNRYVSTLNQQEDQISKLKDQLAELKDREAAKQGEIDSFLSSLSVD